MVAPVAGRSSGCARGVHHPVGPNVIAIRPAEADDAQALPDVVHASAAYRGVYSSIIDGYSVTAAQIARTVIHAAHHDGTPCGFYSLIMDGEPELDLMFVADGFQGRGVGSRLFRHMTNEAGRRGVTNVRIVPHPPSVGFYQAMGAVVIGTMRPTSKAPWTRPILSLTL